MLDSFILAGGESKRFGSDKLFYKLNGKRLIDYAVDSVYSYSKHVYLVVKDESKFLSVKCDGILRDIIDESSAIVGMLTAMLKSATYDRIILSGDMPFVDKELIKLLLEKHSFNYTIFRVNSMLYPFPGIYNQCIAGELCLYIREGGRSIRKFLSGVPGNIIDIEPTTKLLNVNTFEDLRAISVERL